MTEILRIGRLLETDENGFIVSESGREMLASPWKEAIEEIKTIYIDRLGETIHSIYVRGTASRGEAIEGMSDIDTFAVIHKLIDEVDTSWVKEVCEMLEEKYPFATDIEINFINHEELFEDKKLFPHQFHIKVQSVCVHGEDLSPKIKPFKADKDTASLLKGNLRRIVEKTKERILNNEDGEDVKAWCRWAAKRFLRAGFLLVMDKEQRFTRDLYPSYELFAKYYPEKEEEMKQALNLAINPTDDPRVLQEFTDDFGMWLVEEMERKLDTR